MARDVLQDFMEFNRPFARRSAELIRQKIARMADGGPFAFFRGTFHVYARDVIQRLQAPLPLLTGEGIEMDLVGDLHPENFGAFKADDGGVHYDVNDFDETTHGRFDFDVCRQATGWFLAARASKASLDDAVAATLAGVQEYATTLRRLLRKGKPADLDVRADSPCGCRPVDDVLAAGAAARRPAFIDRLTTSDGTGRRLRRSDQYFNLPDDERARALRLLNHYARLQGKDPEDPYFAALDACGRVAGIGSMGRFRYAVLIAGKDPAGGRNVVLEFKEARPSAYDLERSRDTGDAALAGRAARVIEVQRLSQAASNRHLGWAVDGPLSFQARELGPQDGRVDAKAWQAAETAGCTARVQADVLARIHARAAGRAVGPANPLAEAADADAFCQRVLAFCLGYADVVRRDWQRFTGARAQLEDVASWAG
jgi:uncharacterized protein (DUF2252 family)